MINWSLMIRGWLISLSLTLVLELAYALLWGVRDWHDLILTVLVNILTNPVVVFAAYFIRFRHLPVNYGLATLLLETLAVITEALLYKKHARTISRPWLFALSANSFSYAMGEIVNRI